MDVARAAGALAWTRIVTRDGPGSGRGEESMRGNKVHLNLSSFCQIWVITYILVVPVHKLFLIKWVEVWG